MQWQEFLCGRCRFLSSRQCLSYDACLDNKREDYDSCCVPHLYTFISTTFVWADLTDGLRYDFVFVFFTGVSLWWVTILFVFTCNFRSCYEFVWPVQLVPLKDCLWNDLPVLCWVSAHSLWWFIDVNLRNVSSSICLFCCCASVCRIFIINIANILVLSILYGTKSDCCTAFIYNAWLSGYVCFM